MDSTMTHVSVMAAEVLATLPLKPGVTAVDGTLGLAGHAKMIAERIAPGGILVGLDWDSQMLAEAESRLSDVRDVEIKLFQCDYRQLRAKLESACKESGRAPVADAVLLDLGLNNAQIEDPTRGITFKQDGDLDMRMDRSSGEPASALLNRISPGELESALWNFGDERWARKISQVIVERRKSKPLRTTADLVDCVLAAIPAAKRDKRIHPATRTFQAIRILVNGELDELEEAIFDAGLALAVDGVMVILSYHSGEDRAAKHAIKNLVSTGSFESVFKKPLRPQDAEVAANKKARSAIMRAVRRIAEDPKQS
ncbi:MAG: 16S rRNA (cytosine(1402)-N(4))-methyltransferase RsmH [Fimbriimonadaceae bacterium]|nr:MAG: 16S rRNA (cytosine(1402)-N(4))-methyltransferase RsmH [Fimbriimonadaceae bacterium]